MTTKSGTERERDGEMKVWVKQHGCIFSILPTVLFLFSTILLLLLLLYYVPFRSASIRYAAALNTIAAVPEPKNCALCGQDTKYHAPVILQLNTGLLVELQVYDPQTSTDTGYAKVGEITEKQVTDVLGVMHIGDLTVTRSAGAQTSHVALPADGFLTDWTLFCNRCRALIAQAGAEGYALVDLYSPKEPIVYPVTVNGRIEIRQYSVEVSANNEKSISIDVRGHYFP